MSQAEVVKTLEGVLRPGTDRNWYGARAARKLPKGLDPGFVRRV